MAASDDEPESEWSKGLPSKEELTPLSHSLISGNLVNAFRMKYDEPMTEEDVRRESKVTLRSIFKQKSTPSFDPFPAFQEQENSGKLRLLLSHYKITWLFPARCLEKCSSALSFICCFESFSAICKQPDVIYCGSS